MKKRKLKIDGFKAATMLYGPPKTKTPQQELPFQAEAAQQGQPEKKVGDQPLDLYL